MKTTRFTLLTRLALIVVLCGGALTCNTASAQWFQFGSGGFGGWSGWSDCDHDHGHGQYYDGDDYGYTYQYSQPVQRSGWQRSQPQYPSPLVHNTLPDFLVGKWHLNDGRVGGSTAYEITADGRFITTNTMLVSGGLRQSSSSTQTARYSSQGLQVGNQLYRVAGVTPGVLSLVLNGRELTLVREGGATGGQGSLIQNNRSGNQGTFINLPINNSGRNGTITISNRGGNGGQLNISSQLPSSLQGTWYEVSTNRAGNLVMNRYELNADGGYDLAQFAIQNDEVDLNSPIGRLSDRVSAQQRTVRFSNGQLSLGVGSSFAEGPLSVRTTTDASGQPALSLEGASGSRLWTRQP